MSSKIDPRIAASPRDLVKLGRALMASGQGDKAVAILSKLRAERPDDPNLESAERAVLAHGIPQWHSRMLRDAARNDCYERAIRRAVRPGDVVLDIGSGSGLLAMMAARAGAAHVYSCEAVPAIAETARHIVAANGLAERITIISLHSMKLDREQYLGGGADVVVSEIIADNLLSEGVIASMDHAARCLAKPGARFIPQAGSMRVALAWLRNLPPPLVDEVSGFDLSLFERHVAPQHSISVGDSKLQIRSDAHDLFHLRFGDGTPAPVCADLALTPVERPINGLVQWVRLQMDSFESLENTPSAGAFSTWGAVFHRLPEMLCQDPSQKIAVHADHDGTNPRLWFSRA